MQDSAAKSHQPKLAAVAVISRKVQNTGAVAMRQKLDVKTPLLQIWSHDFLKAWGCHDVQNLLEYFGGTLDDI